jgi:DNA-binding HxlR family transcriptional regulator
VRNLGVFKDIDHMKTCPIEVALNILGKKWALQIIRDLFRGKGRFSDFIKTNPQISTKMLSLRLKELQESGIINKSVVSTTPVKIEYSLTRKGKELNRILFQLAEFSLKNYPKEVYKNAPRSVETDILSLKKYFNISDSFQAF